MVRVRNVRSITRLPLHAIPVEALTVIQVLIAQNADIQKIFAFGGAFEKLLGIITQEGGIEGTVVVQESLTCIDTLLRYNVSNQARLSVFQSLACSYQPFTELFQRNRSRYDPVPTVPLSREPAGAHARSAGIRPAILGRAKDGERGHRTRDHGHDGQRQRRRQR